MKQGGQEHCNAGNCTVGRTVHSSLNGDPWRWLVSGCLTQSFVLAKALGGGAHPARSSAQVKLDFDHARNAARGIPLQTDVRDEKHQSYLYMAVRVHGA